MTLQKCLVRIVCSAPRISHADPLFAKMATLKIDDLFEQSVRIFSYKMSRGMLPSGMASFIGKNDHGHQTRGARSNFFVERSDGRSIKSIAPKCWNPLPQELAGFVKAKNKVAASNCDQSMKICIQGHFHL